MSIATLATVDRPRAFGYGIALGDRLFRLAVAPGRELTIQTAPIEAPRINTTSSPEEAAEDFGLVYARSAFDGGSGLYRAHAEGAAANRFWDSDGVDVQHLNSGEFPEFKLLHDTTLIEAAAGAVRSAISDGSLYVTDGTTLRRTDNPMAVSPTFITDDPHAGDAATSVTDVAVLGDHVYVALGDSGVHRKVDGTWESVTATEVERVWSVKGRIVASSGTALYEFQGTSTVTVTALATLNDGVSWTDVSDGGSHVLAASSDGIVHAFTTESGSLALESQTTFEGESVTTLGQTQGVVAVGTRAGHVGRWYTGTVDDRGQIIDQQLVKEWPDGYPSATAGNRASLFVGVPGEGKTNLWRYDLVTTGVVRHLGFTPVDAVTSILAIEDRLFAGIEGSGMWREASTFVDEGWLIGPLGDFFDADAKSWVGASLETGPLSAGRQVTLSYATTPDALADPDSTAWVTTIERSGGTGVEDARLSGGVVSRYIAGKVTLRASSASDATPSVRSFSFRGFTSSGDEDRIVQAPINVSDQIERPGRARVKVKGRGEREWQALRALEGQTMVMQLFKPELALDGLLLEVSTPVPVITSQGSSTYVSVITFRGRLTASTSASQNSTDGWVGAFATDHNFATAPLFGEEIAS